MAIPARNGDTLYFVLLDRHSPSSTPSALDTKKGPSVTLQETQGRQSAPSLT